jgi:two-component system chemotaxis response regulator CheB
MKPGHKLIVIGASLGGITAVSSIADTLPRDFPVAIVVVIHTAAASLDLMDPMIQPFTGLPVQYVSEDEEIKPGYLYLAPPDHHLVIKEKDQFGFEDGPKIKDSRPAVDRLFESAARVYGPAAIGVVLTGGDSDGTEGLRAIKAAGGITVVQDPTSARQPSMALSALTDDSPDYCVSLDDLAKLLISLISP